MVGMFVCLCLASQKPSEREFFLPAGTHLGVKLLMIVFRRVFLGIRSNSGICQIPKNESGQNEIQNQNAQPRLRLLTLLWLSFLEFWTCDLKRERSLQTLGAVARRPYYCSYYNTN